MYCALSVLLTLVSTVPGATCLAALSTCPWLFQFAPLALRMLHFKLESTIAHFDGGAVLLRQQWKMKNAK